jgi:acetyl esterase
MALDPHVRRFLDRLAALNPPSAQSLTVQQRREALENLLTFAGGAPVAAAIEDRQLEAERLAVRIYTPAELRAEPRPPAMVYFHGGGLVAGSIETHDRIARALATALGVRLLSVEYRLAPEAPFPAGVEDAYAATAAIIAGAREFGIDPQRIVVGGDSAGATLAAVVCQLALARGQQGIAAQFLLCPIMDLAAETDSRRSLASGYFLDASTLRHDLQHYLAAGGDAGDPRVSPLRAAELVGLPPACIHTAEFDPLRDEGREYATRLESAGVRTLYRCHSGMIHLFYGMGAVIPYARAALTQMGADVGALLDRPEES